MTTRNQDIQRILLSRELAEQQRKEIKEKLKRRRNPQYLENTFCRNSLWPSNKR
jgi:hypothetical protein